MLRHEAAAGGARRRDPRPWPAPALPGAGALRQPRLRLPAGALAQVAAGVAVAGSGGSAPRAARRHCPVPRRLLQLEGPALHGKLAGLKALVLNISRAGTRDVLISFSPTEVRCDLSLAP